MQFESAPSKDARCLNTAAGFWMSSMQFVFGPLPIDNTRAAKLGLREVDARLLVAAGFG